MRNRQSSTATVVAALVIGVMGTGLTVGGAPMPVSLMSGRVSIAGTSNIHPYTATTTDVRIMRLQLAGGVADADWADLLKPGAIEAFDISIPAATLSSPKDGIDKTMHKALKVEQYPEITFRLSRVEGMPSPGTFRAIGVLRIAGVDRDVTLKLKTQESGSTLTVNGDVQLLMTDFGVTPPKAMLGMLKTDPKVTVTFETVLALPATAPVATN
jgi:hypothetical protein